ncbi:PAS domain-containing sensor histidine kinase [Bacillus atrophaeus]|uniref:histidine kinase n=3 Tax=Bacillus atrophaeus TaxID=1452 RepID=A0ABM5LVL5_BACA1|nr:PAS domain-containing protein [Bacillus atrophaeus]AMR63174.1 PAS domain-containing sensor histidine kinase [Bacillus subtilis subsp. globigii]ADP31906.1 sporulation-specific ATP-dependent protein histidine kinase [Bacillus atrophaeus 1942]AIK49106.1 sporulation kinase A [Bacillus atrophaeus subsp. globigii]EIM10387.1 sporulation-specific ATP-dependent protein histidine kinase [Bacillus atrophaeus C89]KFK83990.1 sporulation kinase A [Bacillus atrophaeus]
MEQDTQHARQFQIKTDIHAVLTSNGRIIYISANCKPYLSYAQEEMIGSFMKEFLHEEDQFLVESYFYNEHHLMPCTFRLIKKDHTIVWIEAGVEIVTTQVEGNGREIILKMKVLEEESGHQSLNCNKNKIEPEHQTSSSYLNSEFERLVETLPSPLCISVSGKIVYVNNAMLSMLGAETKDHIIGRWSYEFIEEEYHDIVKNRILRMQKGMEVGMIEQTWKRLDGTPVHLEVKAAPAIYKNQRAELLLLIDISSRKKFQTILQKSRERYQLLIQNSIDTIAVIHNGKWVFMNESGISLFEAATYEDLIGKNIYDHLHPCDHEDVKKRIQNIAEHKTDSEVMKQSWFTFQNRLIYTEMVCIPTTFFGETAVQVILRDISERKQTEELMLKSEKLSIAGQLAAGIAHEIRNPLTAIKGFLQLMKPTMEGNEHYFDIVFSELSRIELILSELLMLAKPQQHAFKEHLNLKKLISEVTALLETQANLNGIFIKTAFQRDSIFINGDQNQLKQVFINLIKNAVESMPDGGTVEIDTTEDEHSVHVTIKDEGEGIPEKVLKRIGEPFLTTKEKGTGLGLMVTFNIIENHQGTIQVDSKPEKGTAFKISFPKK